MLEFFILVHYDYDDCYIAGIFFTMGEATDHVRAVASNKKDAKTKPFKGNFYLEKWKCSLGHHGLRGGRKTKEWHFSPKIGEWDWLYEVDFDS